MSLISNLRIWVSVNMRFGDNLKNLVALAVIQGSNAILPLLVFPYLLAIVGDVNFSKIVVTEGVALIALCVVIYSFEVDGVAKIVKRDLVRERRDVSQVFYAVLYSRVLIFSAIFFFFWLFTSLLFSEFVPFVFAWALMLIGYALQSTWFFQAVERNVAAASILFAARALCIVLVWGVVKSPEEYLSAAFLIGGSYLLSGAILCIYAILKFSLFQFRVSVSQLKEMIFSGRHIFYGNFSVILFRGSNVLILSLFANEASVALYSLAEKLTKCVQAVARPLNQYAYPRVLKKVSPAADIDIELSRLIFKYTQPQLAVLALLVSLFLPIVYFFSDAFLSSEILVSDFFKLMVVMLVAVFFGVANFMFGTVGLNNVGLKKYYASSIFFVGILSVITCAFLSWSVGAVGAALAFSFGEVMLFAMVIVRFWSSRRWKGVLSYIGKWNGRVK